MTNNSILVMINFSSLYLLNFSWIRNINGSGLLFTNLPEREISFRDSSKFPVAEEEDPKATATGQDMPRTHVMLRLILTMVGRKLSRNPNTYSSVIGLLWSLISFKWVCLLTWSHLIRGNFMNITDDDHGCADGMWGCRVWWSIQ